MARRIIYSATDSTHGTELWITDGTAAGTSFLIDLTKSGTPLSTSSNPQDFTPLGNGLLLFTATADGTANERQLYITDGTAAGTHLVRTEDYGGFAPINLKAIGNGKAVFDANHGQGRELWITDGTDAGTFQVKDIFPGSTSGTPNSSFPEEFMPVGNGRLVFNATDSTHGNELWVTDGTAAGTSLVKDINPAGNSGPGYLTGYGASHVVFQATEAADGTEPWITDGTAAGTSLLADLNPGSASTNPDQFFDLGNGRLVFRGNFVGSATKLGLYASDGTTSGTVLINSNAGSPLGFASLGNGRAVFEATDNSGTFQGAGVWVTDGTAAGTSVIAHLTSPSGGISSGIVFQSLGDGRAVFAASAGYGSGPSDTGVELYVTDGTSVTLVKDINTKPLYNDGSTQSSYPANFAGLGGGRALFSATDGTGYGLWVTDGTAAGTTLLNAATPATNGVNALPPVEITGTLPTKAATGDFNGDGKSDILLQNDNGAIVIETTNGLSISGGGLLYNPGPTAHVVASTDLNGDGQNDVLLEYDNGSIVDYLMSGTTITAATVLTNPGSSWHVRGTGDFNADGKADILLQNDSGLVFVEYTDGTSILGGASISNPGQTWTVEGVADFNGDGQPDILLQNTNGTLVDFLMNGSTVAAGYQLLGPTAGYSVAGTGNYNGDNRADILLHNDDGTEVILDTNGQVVIGSSAPIGSPGPTWTTAIGGVDYNGDGISDILIENASGTLIGYTLGSNGIATAGAGLTTAGAGWRALGGPPIQFIDGTGPATTLAGTPGVDEFNFTAFTAGIHTITNFNAASDLIALSSASFPSYAAVQPHEVAYNGGTAIGLSANAAIVIQGVTPDQLSSANFVLR